jgi:hypothetical protein
MWDIVQLTDTWRWRRAITTTFGRATLDTPSDAQHMHNSRTIQDYPSHAKPIKVQAYPQRHRYLHSPISIHSRSHCRCRRSYRPWRPDHFSSSQSRHGQALVSARDGDDTEVVCALEKALMEEREGAY